MGKLFDFLPKVQRSLTEIKIMDAATKANLEKKVSEELKLLNFPKSAWTMPHFTQCGEPILDALIIGAGMAGLSIAFGLMCQGITRICVVDRHSQDKVGSWNTFARIPELRTPKLLTSIDLGIASLTFQAWFKAIYGEDAWANLEKISRDDWVNYLSWYKNILKIPVEYETSVEMIDWSAQDVCLVVTLSGAKKRLYARTLVLATGYDGSGEWNCPKIISESLTPDRYALAYGDILVHQLQGKRVGVIGGGASAYDHAILAASNGSTQVSIFHRRSKMPTYDPFAWASFPGFLQHFADLPDRLRWKFIQEFQHAGQFPSAETFKIASQYSQITTHFSSPIIAVRSTEDSVVIETPVAQHELDFLIIAAGVQIELSKRKELGNIHSKIALWKDRYSYEEAGEISHLENYPYLGSHFEFTEKQAGQAPWLSRIFNFTFGSTLSMGVSGGSIQGIIYGVPQLIRGITRHLFIEDKDLYYTSLLQRDVLPTTHPHAKTTLGFRSSTSFRS